jgi:hypothetical protein
MIMIYYSRCICYTDRIPGVSATSMLTVKGCSHTKYREEVARLLGRQIFC